MGWPFFDLCFEWDKTSKEGKAKSICIDKETTSFPLLPF